MLRFIRLPPDEIESTKMGGIERPDVDARRTAGHNYSKNLESKNLAHFGSAVHGERRPLVALRRLDSQSR